jgi:hypothetical protein
MRSVGAPRIFSLVADKKRRGEIILHDESCRDQLMKNSRRKIEDMRIYLAGTGIS